MKRWRQLWPLLTVLAWPDRWPALAYLASSQHEIAAVKGTGDGEPCLSVSLAVIYGVVGVRRVTAQESSVRLSPLAGRLVGRHNGGYWRWCRSCPCCTSVGCRSWTGRGRARGSWRSVTDLVICPSKSPDRSTRSTRPPAWRRPCVRRVPSGGSPTPNACSRSSAPARTAALATLGRSQRGTAGGHIEAPAS